MVAVESRQRDLEFRRKVRDILVYPAMVMAMAGVVLTIFLIYIIPAFDQVYRHAGASLPPLTRARRRDEGGLFGAGVPVRQGVQDAQPHCALASTREQQNDEGNGQCPK